MKTKNEKKPGAKPGNQNAIGNNGGRPTKYKKEFAELAYNYCLLGANQEDADFMAIIYKRQLQHRKKPFSL